MSDMGTNTNPEDINYLDGNETDTPEVDSIFDNALDSFDSKSTHEKMQIKNNSEIHMILI